MKPRWTRAAVLILAAVLTACSEVPVKPKDKPQYAETPAKINAELGLGYMQQGDMKRAKQKLDLSLHYNPDYEKAHHYIAELYRRLGELDKADKHYKRAIELAPEDSGLHNNYGAFLCERKRFQRAEEQFLLAVHDPLFNGRTQAYENLGLCAADAGEEVKAEKYLRTALKADPRLVKSLFRMAELNYGKGDYLRARAYLERYQEVGPKTAESLWLGVRVEHHMGDREMMQRYAYELSRAFPESPQWQEYTKQRW
jgi:type IV pilus assembly protein PilF